MKQLNLKQALRLKRLHNNLLKANKVMYTTDYTITTNSGKGSSKYKFCFRYCRLRLQVTIQRYNSLQVFLKKQQICFKEFGFCQNSYKQLLSEGKIEEYASAPFCVNPLSVVEGKKKRLVLDLCHVDKFLFIPKFRYEDLSSLSQVFAKDDWFFNWDLKSGYHHVNIYKQHQQYLRFSWVIDGVQRFLFLEFCLSGLPLHVSVLPSS